MILIADCGGSKCEWCLLDGSTQAAHFFTPGMNALMLSAEEMRRRLQDELMPQIGPAAEQVTHVYYYGAGCLGDVCRSVADALVSVLPNAKAEVYSDLLGCARGLLGHKAGIACILGTGSNSCYYDGREIVDNVSSMGFILGDEGGGAYLGKLLVGNVFKRLLPDDICEKFKQQYSLDLVTVIDRVYRKPYPNKFLASLAPFLKENIDHPDIYRLVCDGFRAFFTRNVNHYTEYGVRDVSFCGSIAHYYRDVLASVAAECGFRLDRVMQCPMEGLVVYHSQA